MTKCTNECNKEIPAKDLIGEALSMAGKENVISPELRELDKYRITTDCNIAEEEFLVRMNGTPCFPRKDLTAITGQAKSGKTMLISMLMACLAGEKEEGRVLCLERIREESLKVMWVDTEQSQLSTQRILKNRVARMIGGQFHEEQFYVFNIRAAMVEDRYGLMAAGVEEYQPDIVIIDNVRDFVKDINDGVQAQGIIEGLMKMAEANNCNVVCVLHQNRSAENRGLRGWLGTELMNKAFEVYACQKIMQKQGKKPVFCVEQAHTRKIDMEEPLYYHVDEGGIPQSCDCPTTSQRDGQGRFTSYGKADADTMNQAYIIRHPDNPDCPWEWDLRKLFTYCFADRALMGYQDLANLVMRESGIKYKPYYDKVLALAENARIVKIEKDRCGRIVVLPLPL